MPTNLRRTRRVRRRRRGAGGAPDLEPADRQASLQRRRDRVYVGEDQVGIEKTGGVDVAHAVLRVEEIHLHHVPLRAVREVDDVLPEVAQHLRQRHGAVRNEEAPVTLRRHEVAQLRHARGRVGRRVEAHTGEAHARRARRIAGEAPVELAQQRQRCRTALRLVTAAVDERHDAHLPRREPGKRHARAARVHELALLHLRDRRRLVASRLRRLEQRQQERQRERHSPTFRLDVPAQKPSWPKRMMCGRPSFSALKSTANSGSSTLPSHENAFTNCSSSAPPLSHLESKELEKYTRLPSQLCETMLSCAPIFCSWITTGLRGSDTSKTCTVPSTKLSTNSVLSSEEREMSTGSGGFAGSPIGARSTASKLPSSLRKIPQSRAVSALEVNA